jgi:hypothetical protein
MWESSPFCQLKLWTWILRKAAYEPYRDLEAGQLYASVRYIQEAMIWHNEERHRDETPSKTRV